MKELNKNNPFKTPEEYFENLTAKVMDSIDSESSKLPVEDGYIAPEGYFNGLNDKIRQRLENETKVVQLPSYRKFYWAAASIAAVFILIFGIDWSSNNKSNWDDLVTADIEAYLEDDELHLSSYELAEILTLDEIEINDILDKQFEDDKILEYLNENIDQIEDLNIEDYD